ncbi:glycosyltransferase family 2 protein [Halorubrum sp. SS5]|nr:glycosyltransferase family 2 protein [Halorubrum sp. SS5]
MIEKKSPKVNIIIVNYNGKKRTKKCLLDINNLKYDNFETVVVENGSTNNPIDSPNDLPGELHLIINEVNKGYSAGANDGIKYSLNEGADYILLLNNDMNVPSNLLTRLIKTIQSDDGSVAVSCPIRFIDNDEIQYAGGDLKPRFAKANFYNEVKHREPYETDALLGALILISADFLEEINGLDEHYFFGHDDIDLSYTIKERGRNVLVDPSVEVYHKGSASAGTWNSFRIYHSTRNRLYFIHNKLGVVNGIIAYIYFLISRLYLVTLMTDLIKSKRMFSRETMRGFYDYYRGNESKGPDFFD